MNHPSTLSDEGTRQHSEVSGRLLTGRFVSRRTVGSALKDAMFVLLQAHFCGVERSAFETDLDEKNWVILLEDGTGALRGFSTLLVYEDRSLGRPVTVVYSGDTIVESGWWGSTALPLTWLRVVQQIVPAHGNVEAYWLLITSGFRTYRFLPVFFRRFYPAPEGEARDARTLEVLARARFGTRYDAHSGVVRLPRPQVLAPELIEVPAKRRADPYVSFFLNRNPGYTRGDELVCIAKIGRDNLSAAGRRILNSLSSNP